jgi:hypothetical protein
MTTEARFVPEIFWLPSGCFADLPERGTERGST